MQAYFSFLCSLLTEFGAQIWRLRFLHQIYMSELRSALPESTISFSQNFTSATTFFIEQRSCKSSVHRRWIFDVCVTTVLSVSHLSKPFLCWVHLTGKCCFRDSSFQRMFWNFECYKNLLLTYKVTIKFTATLFWKCKQCKVSSHFRKLETINRYLFLSPMTVWPLSSDCQRKRMGRNLKV